MKNTSGPEDSIFRKKGFFIALYSCLGVVAALALVVSIATRPQYDPNHNMAQYQEDAVPVGADQVEGYLANADEEAWFRQRQQPTPPPMPPTPPPGVTPPPRTTMPVVPPTPADDASQDDDTNNDDTQTDDATQSDEDAATTAPESTPPPPPPEPRVQEADYFTEFTSDDRMAWPVYGDIVMPFSMTHFIYDPTLDQFRTNDHVRIAAEEGDPVRAAADGRVVSVGREARRGHYVTIDHGNGWLSTYGQLMENSLVSEGDIVRSGQVIGGVGRQTIFTSLNGTHVHLQVKRDNEPVNPYVWLEARAE